MNAISKFCIAAVLLTAVNLVPCLLAQNYTARLDLEQSTDGLSSWQRVPITTGMLNNGSVDLSVISSSAFYRLKVELVQPPTPTPTPSSVPPSFIFYGPTGNTGVNGGSAGDYIPWKSDQTAAAFRYNNTSQTFQQFIDRRLAANDRITGYYYDMVAEKLKPLADRPQYDINFPQGAGDSSSSIQCYFAHPVTQDTLTTIIDPTNNNTASMIPVGGFTATTQGVTCTYNGVNYRIYGWWGPNSNTTKPTKISN